VGKPEVEEANETQAETAAEAQATPITQQIGGSARTG
jgi:hypothetical protein